MVLVVVLVLIINMYGGVDFEDALVMVVMNILLGKKLAFISNFPDIQIFTNHCIDLDGAIHVDVDDVSMPVSDVLAGG